MVKVTDPALLPHAPSRGFATLRNEPSYNVLNNKYVSLNVTLGNPVKNTVH